MKITVILCTYNRCQSLRTALNSTAALVLPESVEWEILVVDNNSKDQTRDTVQDFCARYPGRFRYVFEPRPGKSNALNTGLRESHADVFAFLDDDIEVDPHWLHNLTAALHNGAWAGAAGRIIPQWSCPPPRWLAPDSRYAAGPLVSFHPSTEAGQLNTGPIGTNMAFHREMFEKYGGFRTDLGPCPDAEISSDQQRSAFDASKGKNEDSEFGDRLLAAGEPLRYEPSALVYHPVSENRLTKQYFLTWWLNKGEANIRQFGVEPGTKYRVAGVPLYLLRRFAKWTLKWLVTVNPIRRFSSKLNAWENLGEISECYREWSAPRRERRIAALD